MHRRLAARGALHAKTAVLIGAEEFTARDEALAAREVYSAHRAADHILACGRVAGWRRRRRGWLLLVFDTAKPSNEEVDDDDQRDEKQEFSQAGALDDT